jgi:hypothetical protein
MKHCTDLEITASSKIQAAIILLITTQGIKENKTAYIK